MMHRILQMMAAGLVALSLNVFAEGTLPADSLDLSQDAFPEAVTDAATVDAEIAKEMAKEMAAEKGEAFVQELLNINTANADEISSVLKGVGPVKAAAIVEYREKYGPFKTLNELAQVKGVGEKTVAQNEALITFE